MSRFWGSGDLTAVFGDAAKVVAPWPRAPRSKRAPNTFAEYARQVLDGPVWLSEVDPRLLFASQGWVLRQHTEYYRTGEWERTGITSADQDSEANRFPIVVSDLQGRRIIATGHHRALAALIEGRPLLCRRAPDAADDAVALLPHLLYGPSTRLHHVICQTVTAAVETVRRGETVLCPDIDVARAAAVALSPTFPHRHLAAIHPPKARVAVEDAPPPRRCATGLCTTCGGLTSRLDGRTDETGGDHCRCEPRPHAVTSQDAERRLACQLCQVCRLEVVRAHTRWHKVMCETCLPLAVAFNQRIGRKVLLPGIHSMVNDGPLLKVRRRPPTNAHMIGFADQLNGMFGAVSAFGNWSDQALLERLRTLGFEPGRVIPLREYMTACKDAGIDKNVGWAELEAHLHRSQRDEIV